MVMVMATVYARAGEPDKAVDELEIALSVPGFISAPWLSIDPLFDSIRSNPNFLELLEREHELDIF